MKLKNLTLGISYIFIAAIIAVSVLGFQAHADTTAASASGAQAGSLAGAQSNLGVTQDFRNYSINNQPAPDYSRAIGAAIAPAIPGSLITCQGGVSASGGFMGGAFAIGKSIESDPCNLRQNAMLLHNIGDDQAARIVMCIDDNVREAYRLTDRPCPQDNPGVNSAQIKANSEAKQLALQAQFDKRYGVDPIDGHVISKPKGGW